MLLLSHNLYFATAAHWFRALVLASVIIFGTACGSLSSSATLNMDVPANIRVDAEAYYQPISSHYCFVPENYPSAPNVGVKKFSQPAKPTAHTSKFDVKPTPQSWRLPLATERNKTLDYGHDRGSREAWLKRCLDTR